MKAPNARFDSPSARSAAVFPERFPERKVRQTETLLGVLALRSPGSRKRSLPDAGRPEGHRGNVDRIF